MLFIEFAITIALVGYIMRLRKEIRTRDIRNSWVYGHAVIPMVVLSDRGEVRISTNLWDDLFGQADNEPIFKNRLLAALEPLFQEALRNGVCGRTEPIRLISRDGSERWYNVYCRRYDMDSPEIAIRLVDITQAKTAGDLASHRDNIINAIMINSHALISFMNRDGTYALVNENFAKAVGIPANKIIGLTNYDIASKDYADRYAANDELVMGRGEGITFEEDAPSENGMLTFTSIKFPIRDINSAIVGMGSIIYDVTKEKKAEKERAEAQVRERAAVEASTTKSVFLANMSHELRTPINGIMGMADLLRSTDLNGEQRMFAHSILQSADGLLTLVNDILDLTKAEAGKIEVETVPFTLDRIFKEVESTTGLSARQKSLQLSFHVPASHRGTYLGDPTRLRQVVMNLVSNAIKFTLAGSVSINVREWNDALRFEIADTGIGIQSDSQSKLFTSFSQADASTTRKFGGSGLGLAISKQLVELMGGQIGFEKQLRGSLFWFTVPKIVSTVRLSSERDFVTVERPRTRVQASKLRILIAEDNRTNQIIAAKMLQKLGHETVVVENGAQALKALDASAFDLIFMDCQMPEMDGYEATAAIRAGRTRASVAIPVIALTANAMRGDREKCLEAGMSDYISKPMKASDLESAIERAVLARAA